MGLRVGITQGVLSALRGINIARTQQESALERISTGLRINRAADNPAGLVISEILRAQIGSTAQAVENVEFASNMVTTAEGGLSEISSLLSRGRSLAVQALNTGVMSSEQRQALQGSMDQIVQAINRISSTTRFGGLDLLNGAQAIRTGNVAPELEQVRIFSFSAEAQTPTNINVQVLAPATRAQATGTIAAVQSGASTIRIRGELGTVELTFQAGTTRAQVAQAINQFSQQTGVQADAATGIITSTDVGSPAFVEITELQGDFEGITPSYTTGTDIQGTIAGQVAQGNRNVLSVASDYINAEITVDRNAPAGSYTFDITGGGMIFQLGTGTSAADRIRIGIESTAPGNLGLPGNYLSSLVTGGANSLMTNPAGAIDIIDRAINQITQQRGSLGAFQSQLLETNRNALEVAFQNLIASESSIRDGDIAEEIANALRSRIVGQAGMSALRNANIFQSSVLRLLT